MGNSVIQRPIRQHCAGIILALVALVAGAAENPTPTPAPVVDPRTIGGPCNMGVFGCQIEPNKPLPAIEYLELSLPLDATRGNEILTIRLYSRAGRITDGYAYAASGKPFNAPKAFGYMHRIDEGTVLTHVHASELVRNGDKLSGRVGMLYIAGENPIPDLTAWLDIEATVKDGKIAGTFSAPAAGRGLAKLDKVALTGRVVPESELTTAERTLAKDASWPGWRGPNGNGTPMSCDRPLVRDWKDARLVWKSEAHVLGNASAAWPHAHNSPIAADNLVFVHNTEPNVENDTPNVGARGRYKMGSTGLVPKALTERTYGSMYFDDVVWAIDARTGATVWKRRWYKCSINDVDKNSNGMFSSPIYHEGKLYLQLLKGRVVCLNARTGETVWESSSDPAWTKSWAEDRDKVQAKQLEPGAILMKHQKDIQAAGALVGGVLVWPKRSGALIGMDPANGKQIWESKGKVLANYSSPVKWVHKGKAYILTGNALLDPKDGKILWAINGNFGVGPTANAEYLLSHNPFSVWKISSEKVEQAWSLPMTDEEKNVWEKKLVGNSGYYMTASLVSDNAFLLPGRRAGGWSVRLNTDGKWITAKYDEELSLIGSSMLAGDLVILPFESLGPRLFQWNAATGELKKMNPHMPWGNMATDNAMCTSPILVDGRLFYRVNDGVVCFDLRATK